MSSVESLGPLQEDVIERIQGNPEEARVYLNAALAQSRKDKNIEVLLCALRTLAEVKGGVESLSEGSGMNHQDLCEILSGKRYPRWEEIADIFRGLGYYLSVVRIQKTSSI